MQNKGIHLLQLMAFPIYIWLVLLGRHSFLKRRHKPQIYLCIVTGIPVFQSKSETHDVTLDLKEPMRVTANVTVLPFSHRVTPQSNRETWAKQTCKAKQIELWSGRQIYPSTVSKWLILFLGLPHPCTWISMHLFHATIDCLRQTKIKIALLPPYK